jgi:LysR family transcriptional regulator, transcriptional activator of nhaA
VTTFLNFLHLRSFWVTAQAGSLRAAAERWHISQPALSEQIKLLELALGSALFRKASGRLVLTEAGRRAYDYAEQIFTLSQELCDELKPTTQPRHLSLAVGVADSLPKLLAWSFVRPSLQLKQTVRLNCREGKAIELLDQLAAFRLDVVLSDEPAPSHFPVHLFNQPLSCSTLTFMGLPDLAKRYGQRFPLSLNEAPLVLPSLGTAMRSALDKWLHDQALHPRIVAECDDSAMQKAAAYDGVGFVAVPTVEVDIVRSRYGFESVGEATECHLTYYAITAMRKINHPAVVAILKAAQKEILS